MISVNSLRYLIVIQSIATNWWLLVLKMLSVHLLICMKTTQASFAQTSDYLY